MRILTKEIVKKRLREELVKEKFQLNEFYKIFSSEEFEFKKLESEKLFKKNDITARIKHRIGEILEDLMNEGEIKGIKESDFIRDRQNNIIQINGELKM